MGKSGNTEDDRNTSSFASCPRDVRAGRDRRRDNGQAAEEEGIKQFKIMSKDEYLKQLIEILDLAAGDSE